MDKKLEIQMDEQGKKIVEWMENHSDKEKILETWNEFGSCSFFNVCRFQIMNNIFEGLKNDTKEKEERTNEIHKNNIQSLLNESRFIGIDFLMKVLPQEIRDRIMSYAFDYETLESNEIPDGKYLRDMFKRDGSY